MKGVGSVSLYAHNTWSSHAIDGRLVSLRDEGNVLTTDFRFFLRCLRYERWEGWPLCPLRRISIIVLKLFFLSFFASHWWRNRNCVCYYPQAFSLDKLIKIIRSSRWIYMQLSHVLQSKDKEAVENPIFLNSTQTCLTLNATNHIFCTIIINCCCTPNFRISPQTASNHSRKSVNDLVEIWPDE